KAESSTISTRVLLEEVAMAGFACGSGNRLRGLRSNELLDGFGELIFLNWFGEESYGAFLDGAIAMFYASTRSDHHHGNAARGRALAELGHEFVTGHARHFEVGDDQMTAVLGDEFGRFETVGSEHDAVAGLL